MMKNTWHAKTELYLFIPKNLAHIRPGNMVHRNWILLLDSLTRYTSAVKWSGGVELYPNLLVTGMIVLQILVNLRHINAIPERYLPLSQRHHAENDLPMMFLYGIINHWRAWSLSFVKLIWINNKFTGWHNGIKNVLYLYSCEGSDNKLEMWQNDHDDCLPCQSIQRWDISNKGTSIFSGSQTKHLRQLHWKLKVWTIFWWPLNLYHSGNTDEKPIHVIHMHSTRFRLSSNTQPVTSLLTPSGPPSSGRTLLIRLLSAKSLNIMYTRNTANLRSHNVTGGENLIQRAKQLMAPWITQGRIDNWQFTADNHLSSVLAVYGGQTRHYLIFSISSQCTKLLGSLKNLSHHLSTTIRRLTINKVPPVF